MLGATEAESVVASSTVESLGVLRKDVSVSWPGLWQNCVPTGAEGTKKTGVGAALRDEVVEAEALVEAELEG